MHWAARLMRDCGLELVVFNGIASVITAAFAVFYGSSYLLPAFGFIILLMSVGLMLIGGALDIANTGYMQSVVRMIDRILVKNRPVELEGEESADDKRKVGSKAATYALTGVLLFTEAGLLAYSYFL